MKSIYVGSWLVPVLLLALFFGVASSGDRKDSSLSRRKRYVVFPEGSSFSVAFCMTVHTLSPDNIFTEGVNWGISYDLPNESKAALEPLLEFKSDKIEPPKGGLKIPPGYGGYYYKNHDFKNPFDYPSWNKWNSEGASWKHGVPPAKKRYTKHEYYYNQRRHRRELYNKLEVIMNAMGFDGRSCILRALCEASQRLMPKGSSLVEEMMRIAFSLPLKRVFSFEPSSHHEYTGAHKAGQEGRNCVAMFPGCSFSLVDMALGRYNAPDRPPRDPETSKGVTGTSGGSETAPPPRYNMK
ncbi:uncharacterized protein LOC105701932 [Orussus abietinus]|uniref:uncharacterized protein LOC105701932 n=1 Tax=Orussus abietinus TaxID=222816 RepID=UPI000625F8D1|nr:uncharacterized protein LOC105701932 [Orussus abietinus]